MSAEGIDEDFMRQTNSGRHRPRIGCGPGRQLA